MEHVVKATYKKGYTIELIFNNEVKGSVNLYDVIFNDHRPIFKELTDESKFKKFKVAMNTIVWDNGLDLAPEFLYDLVKKSTDNCT